MHWEEFKGNYYFEDENNNDLGEVWQEHGIWFATFYTRAAREARTFFSAEEGKRYVEKYLIKRG